MATISDFIKEWNSEKDYIAATTSGSTGTPKTIFLHKSDMITSARATIEFFGINEKSVLASPLSVDYIAGKMMVVRALLAGCKLIELPVSNTIQLDCPVDFLPVVPSQIPSLLADGANVTRIKNLLVGGAPLSEEMAYDLIAGRFNAWLGYGMTETCSHVAISKIGGDKAFSAMPGITFETDNRGCLVINSDKFSWKRLVTNDVVRLISNTEFEWLGRYDNVIISGGVKLHPEILEKQIRRKYPELPPFYLVGEPDAKWGQSLVMVIENAPDDLFLKLKASLPDKKTLPKRIISVDELPTTANGKIKRIIP